MHRLHRLTSVISAVLFVVLSARGAAPVAATAPQRQELLGAARSDAIDQLQALRHALRTRLSGLGEATARNHTESANKSGHRSSSGSYTIRFAFDERVSMLRVASDDARGGAVTARLRSDHEEVLYHRDTARGSRGEPAGRVWSIDRWSDRAAVPQGRPVARPGFSGGGTDVWTYSNIVGVPGHVDEAQLIRDARRGTFGVFREGQNLVFSEEDVSARFGKSSQEFVFSLALGGVPLRAEYHTGENQSQVYTIDWRLTPQGDVVPARYTVRVAEMNAESTAWHLVQTDVAFQQFELGPVPPASLSVRALGGPEGIPPGTSVIDLGGQQLGKPPPSFIYSEPAWKRMFGEDPAQELGTSP